MALNGVIGRDGAMPWHLPSDLRRFRRLTMGKPMIMGRRTLEAIGRALDGRDSVVLTRRPGLAIEGAHAAPTPDAAVEMAARLAAGRGAHEIAVIGGAEVYRLLAERLDRLHVTHVETEPDGDARFFPIEPRIWRLVRAEPRARDAGDDATTRYALYERRSRG